MSRSQIGVFLASTAALCGFALQVAAQQQGGDNPDDPNHGVARISIIQGEVNVKRGDSGDVVAAALNAPLMRQDRLQTGDGSRAEIQFDAADMVRLAPNTDLNLADLRRGQFQMQLGSGTVMYRSLRDFHAQAEIDTPSVAVRPKGVSAVRVAVYGDGATAVTVRAGEVEIDSPKGSQTLAAGQTMLARGNSSDPEFQIESAVPQDQFDEWSYNRDRELSNSRSSQYVSPDIDGAQDLDAYGSWVPSPQGTVWAPRVPPDWAPYHYGRWAWEDYYGWTWVDYDPWGWAPFHYGRWFENGSAGWCWWPGPVNQPYFWRPALVGFFGFGGFGVGIGFGNVGWVALAPFEPWHPWYGRGFGGGEFGRRGFGGFNRGFGNNTIVNNVNIYNSYRNARINNGVAYTGVNNFGRGSQMFNNANGSQLRNASLVRGQLPVTPGRSSLAFSNRQPSGNQQLFGAPRNQRFFEHQQLPQMQRASFAQQQQNMAQFQQRTLGFRPNLSNEQARTGGQSGFRSGASQAGNGSWGSSGWPANTTGRGPQNQPNSSWNQSGSNVQRGGQTQTNRSWSNQGPASSMSRPQQSFGSVPGNRQAPTESGWHRFGDPGAGSFGRAPANATSSNGYGGSWHNFGSPSDNSQRPMANSNRPGSSFTQSGRFSQSPGEQMRMNPSIVHERPSYSAPSFGSSRGGSPHYNAPSGNRGGGGGGGGRSSGGRHR